MELPPPNVPEELLEGWSVSDRSIETPFDLGVVTVTAHTVVYEDERRRERIREAAGIDGRWRFIFASRVRIRPETVASNALTRIVRSRAENGFEARLTERGFDGVTKEGTRSMRIGRSTATLTRYRGRCRVGETTVPTAALFAVWPSDRDYYVAGGAYPTGVPSALEDTAALFDPDADRAELLRILRSMGDE